MLHPLTRSSLTLAAAALSSVAVSAQFTLGSFVKSGTGCPADSALPLGDDSVVAGLQLGFAFPFADGGGSTTEIDVSSNGYVYLESGTITSNQCCSGSLFAFANATRQIALLGEDLNPNLGGAVLFETNGTDTATITFDGINYFGGATPNVMQCQLHSNGNIVLCYTAQDSAQGGLVGYSPGNAATDPGAIDLSAGGSGALATDMVYETFAGGAFDLTGTCITFTPNANGSYDLSTAGMTLPVMPRQMPMDLSADSAPTIGQTTTVSVTEVPAGSGLVNLMFASAQQALPLDSIGADGCTLYVDQIFHGFPMNLVGSQADRSFPFPADPVSVGAVIELQAAALGVGINPLGVVLSDLGTLTMGEPLPEFVCDGSNTFNSNTAFGFFRLTNREGQDIVSLTVDFNANLPGKEFDTDQGGVASRFDGGNSTMTGCENTFRNMSDVVTGLDYSVVFPSTCDGAVNAGWVGSNPIGGVNDYETLTFAFTDFNDGETFEFDCDTDGPGGVGGDDMAGMVVTITLADSTVLTGVVAALGPDLGGVNL